MDFALSTNWNSARHESGEALVDEAVALGFDGLELGYGFMPHLADGVQRRVAAGAITVGSVHAYCPVPIGAPGGHPELFLMADCREDMRRMAVIHLLETLVFAAYMGAKAVVAHAGRVPVGALSHRLADAHRDGRTDGWRYRLLRGRLWRRRERLAPRHLTALRRSLDELLPAFAQERITLCLENLPSWDAVPNAGEMQDLLTGYDTPALGCWHDIGHGQVRENLGLDDHRACAERLLSWTRGTHIHDVQPPDHDHLAPGTGLLDFSRFAFLAGPDIQRVFEPSINEEAEALALGLRHVRAAWGLAPAMNRGSRPS